MLVATTCVKLAAVRRTPMEPARCAEFEKSDIICKIYQITFLTYISFHTVSILKFFQGNAEYVMGTR